METQVKDEDSVVIMTVLQPSPPPGNIKNLDSITDYTISGNDFKSWNNDPHFAERGLNGFYFQYQKPHKIEVEFVGGAYGVVDVVSWHPQHPQYEVKPIALHLQQLERQTTKFQFYANPFYLNGAPGFFEPRVYRGWHSIRSVKVKKLATLKVNKQSEYTLFLLKRARKMLDLALGEYDAADYGFSLHFSRFVIELSLKGMYTVFGLNFEREHDIEFSKELRRKIHTSIPVFPISRLLWICKMMASPPRIDFYGDELGFVPSYAFIEQKEAAVAIDGAKLCYEWSSHLLDSIQKAS